MSRLAMLTVDGHACVVPIDTAFDPPAVLLPTVASVHPAMHTTRIRVNAVRSGLTEGSNRCMQKSP